MNFVVVVFIFVFVSAARPNDEENVEEKISDDGDTFKLQENDPFWQKISDERHENGHRNIPLDAYSNNSEDQDEHQKLTLKEFLETYAKKHNKKPIYYGNDDNSQSLDELIRNEHNNKDIKDKSKSQWTLLDVQKHKHPYDERKGWVSLEPIPWSVSKISKWQSKYKSSSERPWDKYGPISSQRPYDQDDDFDRPISITPPSPYIYHRPTESSDRFDSFYDHEDQLRPTSTTNAFHRPTAYFGNKVHVEAHFPSSSHSSTGKPYHYQYENSYHRPSRPYDDIITDGEPSNFPQSSPYDALRRKGTEMTIHSENHPFNGEGEWVLLSTTKGYKPRRHSQRSMQLDSTSEPSETFRASRGVRLTVLPPLKGSNVNMTTSHGGLLQVESTFESVEQAKQKYDKKQKTSKTKPKRKRRKSNKKNIHKDKEETNHKLSTAPQYRDPSAVMAAVGAGMIPATMAMMVPLAMSG